MRAGDRGVERAPLVARVRGPLLRDLVGLAEVEHAADRHAGRGGHARQRTAGRAGRTGRDWVRGSPAARGRGRDRPPGRADSVRRRPRPKESACTTAAAAAGGVLPPRHHGHRIARPDLEHHDGHDAAGVGLAAALDQPNVGGEAARRGRDRRGGARVQPRLRSRSATGADSTKPPCAGPIASGLGRRETHLDERVPSSR